MKNRWSRVGSLLFHASFVLIAMGDLLPGRPVSSLMSMRTRVWVELGLATPVCLWSAWPFFVRAIASVKNRTLNMFTLVGLGVVATAVLEIPTFWRVLHGGPLPTGSAYVSAKEA